MLAVHTILHPTDFSENSQGAFWLACALARDYSARLIVLHVAPVPTVFYGEGMLPPAPEDLLVEPQAQLARLEVPHGDVRAERRLEQGDAVAEILRVAQEAHADLIIMGTHGRTGLARLLMGSVAELIVRKAACPVLTVKTPFPETAPALEGTEPDKADHETYQGPHAGHKPRRTAMQLKDIMTRGVECVRPSDSIAAAAEKMRTLDVGALPVCGDQDRLVGMVTDRDITVRATASCCEPDRTFVNEVMTPDIAYVFEDQDVSEAAQRMRENQIRRLVVLNRDKRLVGIVSLGDLAVDTGDDEMAGDILEAVSEPAQPRR